MSGLYSVEHGAWLRPAIERLRARAQGDAANRPTLQETKGAGTALANRELVERADTFPFGTHRVFAWFAVSLPTRYRQEILFQWFHDGAKMGGPVTTTITGGRETGWRTTTSRANPAPGRWRADVLNVAGQLIGRVTFDVTP